MLLGVVEENRKKEVLDNLGVCAQLVENIKKQLAEIEGKPANICFEKKEKKKQQQNSRGPVHTKTIVNANDSKRIFLSPSTRRRSSFT